MKGITEDLTPQETRTPKRLSATFVKTVTRPGRYGDGRGSHGLSLLVKPMKLGGHSRTWSQRLRINGKPASIGLGSFPVVTLAEARKAALGNRRALAQGHDPRTSVPTLAQASERILAIHCCRLRKRSIRSVAGKRSAAVFAGHVVRGLPVQVQPGARAKLLVIDAAVRLGDLRSPPGNRLEALRGDRQGQHSIRINDRWRIFFSWRDGEAWDVEITDSH